jgi:hypothetical protein
MQHLPAMREFIGDGELAGLERNLRRVRERMGTIKVLLPRNPEEDDLHDSCIEECLAALRAVEAMKDIVLESTMDLAIDTIPKTFRLLELREHLDWAFPEMLKTRMAAEHVTARIAWIAMACTSEYCEPLVRWFCTGLSTDVLTEDAVAELARLVGTRKDEVVTPIVKVLKSVEESGRARWLAGVVNQE